MKLPVSISGAAANALVQTLADLLDEATHQLWHATQDPEHFDRATAWKAYLEIKARAAAAVKTAFDSAGKPGTEFPICPDCLWPIIPTETHCQCARIPKPGTV